MPVSKKVILQRGLANHCPNCGEGSLFPPPPSMRINPACPNCGMKFDRGEGFFLGPFVINYTVTVVGFIIPAIVLYLAGTINRPVLIVAMVFGTFVLPALLYRRSWGWWLTTYFFFLPQKLPANRGTLGEEDEE
jgi:uncharacterized protein (DUF983 family)